MEKSKKQIEFEMFGMTIEEFKSNNSAWCDFSDAFDLISFSISIQSDVQEGLDINCLNKVQMLNLSKWCLSEAKSILRKEMK